MNARTVRDVEVKAHVRIVNTLEAPRILGDAEVIQGKLVFKDRAFTIDSANVNFDSPTVINPSFNLVSSTDVNGIKVQLFASGRRVFQAGPLTFGISICHEGWRYPETVLPGHAAVAPRAGPPRAACPLASGAATHRA